jgi:hypothetical protein
MDRPSDFGYLWEVEGAAKTACQRVLGREYSLPRHSSFCTGFPLVCIRRWLALVLNEVVEML